MISKPETFIDLPPFTGPPQLTFTGTTPTTLGLKSSIF
jgi:hypothetical protein